MARGVDQLVKQDFVGTVRITPPDLTWRKKYVRARASTLGDGANGLILQVLSANGHTRLRTCIESCDVVIPNVLKLAVFALQDDESWKS